MRQNQVGTNGTATDGKSKKESRGARYLEKNTLTLHDACNVLRFSMADCLRGDLSTKRANVIVGGTREIRRMVETAARITTPTAQGMREIVITDNDKSDIDGSHASAMVQQELAEIAETERQLAERRQKIMATHP